MNDSSKLKDIYEDIAGSKDYRTTASDHQLRELEIDTGASYMADGMTVLDVGCGLGYAATQYAQRNSVQVFAIDYAEKMIEGAHELLDENYPELKGSITFAHASVTVLPYEPNTFDVVTSSRCLMALLDWNLQKEALVEINRVLKPGGVLVLMEGTFDGLERLNEAREKVNLEAIAADGRDRLITRKFIESELLEFVKPFYHLEDTQRFGLYYFLTRVVQPLLVSPEKPSYDHKINEVARQLSTLFPDFMGLGHLVAFIMTKRR
jgi:ubiquinone/menaquinone biosynthesis C-methylase UbiE